MSRHKNNSSAETDEITDERLKGIDPKMVELINNEVWQLFTIKITAQRDLAYRAVSLSGPARLPYKQSLSTSATMKCFGKPM
jgi:hypothetical protein